MKYFVMVGLPGSGKSTIGEKIKNDNNAILISLDSIRKELYGSEEILGGHEVVRTMRERALDALNNGYNVVLDATHLVLNSRKRALSWVSEYEGLEKIAIVINTPLEVCLKRNAERERHVPEEIICKMNKTFVSPSLEEGFTKIVVKDNY